MSPSLSFHKLLTKARKLVPFLPPEPISPHTAKEQDAPLLSRLPPELRQMIWETYFRGYAVHIHRPRKRLRARECLIWDADDVFARGPHFETCFDFSHAARCVTVMSQRLPATHVAHISQINLNWELYYPLILNEKDPGKYEILWVDIWEALAAMEGLKWLRVELRIAMPHLAPEWTEREWTLWEGIKKVTRPSHFELILPFPAAASTREETLPCTIIRRVMRDESH
ncbi:hypothetical protein DL769_001663 [Monosporascus sp. CRB-8-3]|nr:hypothetical protein DL769_001663 [Monosporascus sp. CRB-8-3]